ncbi:putative MFS transporter [Aspergillus clavatus NRRL 1]|uniref:Uncharacterized protein n=1 Tax=Aspergillus clavatus (strain ATCC 1007 / CBS 513.65 / DSM 816 / NCTC 3887 / NRRL 1 / QM 1276 / 107) TaxID=344612 RepID=A1CLG9_ASPCL|nr:uncharacterized protein ACLA_042150 [Aspergillus clavatus NRRL 1]EAW09993.1 hypothetical protein ACLA_042150 [Aspergillus clavatus NRRL 1]
MSKSDYTATKPEDGQDALYKADASRSAKSRWYYHRQELSDRIAWFYAGSSLANAFGGLIGALFIIEGVITVGVSLFSTLFLPNYPDDTAWLDETERAYTHIKEALVMDFKDSRIYLFILLQHLSLLSQTFQYFFPTIVKALGYGNIETLLSTAPVWIATCVVGCVICTASTNIGAKFAMFLMPMGAIFAYPWVANSFSRPLVKRSATIYGSYIWPASFGPRYIPGGATMASVAVLVAVLA